MYFKSYATLLVYFVLGPLTIQINGSQCWKMQGNSSNLPSKMDSWCKDGFKQQDWCVKFSNNTLQMSMHQEQLVQFSLYNIDPKGLGSNCEFGILSTDENIIKISNFVVVPSEKVWQGNFTLQALFMGSAKLYMIRNCSTFKIEYSLEMMEVTVIRVEDMKSMIFKIVVGAFVIILYVNFGAVLDLEILKAMLRKPVGPAIGCISQFVIMPSLSYLIGYWVFFDNVELRLGLFFTGSTPGGGASNLFTVILNGNINLSVAMTAISNLAAFLMMPLWIFTLGALIFRVGHLTVPYATIIYMSFSLLIPLGIGIALQRCAPRIAKVLVLLLKPICFGMIVVITVLGCISNTYIFRLFNWKVIIASSTLPWAGYILGWLLAKVCGQTAKDSLTIAIETGIQNIGLTMFMLNYTLPKPSADLTSVVPVANTLMTPIPLFLLYFLRKFQN